MQWLNNLAQWFDGMTPWFALSAGLMGIVGYLVGFKAILGILEKVLDIVSPILKFVSEAIVAGAKWLWNTIYVVGLGDIIDNWRTVFTVLTIVVGTAVVQDMRFDQKMDAMVDKLEVCQSDNTRLEKELKRLGKSQPEPSWFDGWKLW